MLSFCLPDLACLWGSYFPFGDRQNARPICLFTSSYPARIWLVWGIVVVSKGCPLHFPLIRFLTDMYFVTYSKFFDSSPLVKNRTIGSCCWAEWKGRWSRLSSYLSCHINILEHSLFPQTIGKLFCVFRLISAAF